MSHVNVVPFRRRMQPRDPHETHRVATPLELFFDLVFVVAIASAAAGWHHGLAEGHLGDLVGFIMVFFAIWWAWMNYTWFASAYDCDDVVYRLLTFTIMSGSLLLAAGTPALFATGQSGLVVAGYAVMRFAMVAMWLRAAANHPEGRRTALWYAGGIAAVQVLWIGRLLLDGPAVLMTTFWALVALELLVPVLAERHGVTPFHPHHIAERYALLTIIVLGEVILASVQAVQGALGQGRQPGLVLVILGGLLTVFAMWWLYFKRDHAVLFAGSTREKADGAINFTASHNPPEYNGIKFSTPDGAPALPEVTKQIEKAIADTDKEPGAAVPAPAASGENGRNIQSIDVKSAYLDRLSEIIDLDTIERAGLRVVFDPLWGAARGYSDSLLRNADISVETVHDHRDVLFGGHAPEPDDHLLENLREKMRDKNAQIGIATDGDADRFGIVDEDGIFLQPNYIIALLFDYLVESRGWKNGVGKSVATTNLINALAKHHQVELHETPVGFKYIGELIKQDKIAIGGEESAGLSIRHHVPEKDGILAGLLCCEMVARRKQSLGQQLKALFAKVGSFYPLRENFRLTPEVKEKFTEKLRVDPQSFFGQRVTEVVRKDGLKLVLEDGSWVCYRLSGTEPVVRVYSEAPTPPKLEKLSAAAKQWIFE